MCRVSPSTLSGLIRLCRLKTFVIVLHFRGTNTRATGSGVWHQLVGAKPQRGQPEWNPYERQLPVPTEAACKNNSLTTHPTQIKHVKRFGSS